MLGLPPQQRRAQYAGFVLLMVSGQALLVSDALQQTLGVPGTVIRGVAGVMQILGLGLFMFAYLRGNSSLPDDTSYSGSSRSRDVTLYEIRSLLSEVRSAAASKGGAILDLEKADKDFLVKALASTIAADVRNRVLPEIDAELRESLVTQSKLELLRGDFAEVKNRLRAEIEALTRRGNLNLIIGTLTTLLAVGILAYLVLTAPPGTPSTPDLLALYLPRLSLVVFIEVFAFFFLRLYKASLTEIKYYQNELTNVETRLVALEAALIAGGADTIASLVDKLASTERNFVLQAGETTVELQRARFEAERVGGLIDKIQHQVAGRR